MGGKKYQDKYEELCARNKALVEALSGLVYDHYVVEDVIVWEGYKKVLGFNKKDMGKGTEGWMNLCHPEDIDRVKKELSNTIKGKRYFNLQYRFKTKNGYHWFNDQGVTILDKKGKLLRVIGIMKDITDKIEAEEELKDKIKELKELNRLMVNRELKMLELKNKIKKLESK